MNGTTAGGNTRQLQIEELADLTADAFPQETFYS